MTKTLKKILTNEDIRNIKVGDIVRLSGYGRMMYNGENKGIYSFLGRCRSRTEITEVRVQRQNIFPEGNPDGRGNIFVDTPYNEGTYNNYNRLYIKINRKLKTLGGI